MTSSISNAFDEHAAVLEASRPRLEEQLARITDVALGTVRSGRTILVAGNGGSAADALHFVAELVGRYRRDRAPIAAIALGTDAPTATAIANDIGFEHVFLRGVEAFARPGDLLIALSTSGSSSNVIAAARAATARGCKVAVFTGEQGGALVDCSDLVLTVRSSDTARIQEIHGLCLHALAASLEAEALAGLDG